MVPADSLDPPSAPETGTQAALEFQCTQDECVAALKFNQLRLFRQWSTSAGAIALRIMNLAAWVGAAMFAVRLAFQGDRTTGRWFGFCAVAALAITTIQQILLREWFFRILATGDGTLGARRLLTVERQGLRFRTSSAEAFLAWDGIRSVEEVDGLLLIYQDRASFFLIPASAFSNTAARAEFLALSRNRGETAGWPAIPVPTTAAPAPAAATAPEEPSPAAELPRTLLRGLRLVFFLNPKVPVRPVSWSALVALMFLGVLAPLIVQFVQVGPKGSFYFGGLPDTLFFIPSMILASWALARWCGRSGDVLPLLVATCSLAIPIELIDTILQLAVGTRAESVASDLLAPVWLTLATGVAAIRLLRVPQRRWLGALALAILLVGWPRAQMRAFDTLWWARDEDDNPLRRWSLTNEDVWYLQPRLLEQQLAALKPGRKGVVDLYFIGMAAYADQDVFMKEVHSVAKMFDERFDTAGRSLMLINNPATVAESPFASVTSLEAALRRVAQVMDLDEDILFLFITSHGSRENGPQFEFAPLRFNSLAPSRLRELLDQSGIKRRVVVVSACYSGGFVDALKSDGTLVIASSSADKPSFGCSNDADFTYFGKAYFDEALRKTYSFSQAFELARPLIAERERKASFRGSDPRMYAGEAIQRALAKFIAQREAVSR